MHVRKMMEPLTGNQAMIFNRSILLAAGAITLIATSISSFSNELHPPQKEWVFTEHADVVSGDLYPAAILMSRDVSDVSLKSKKIGNAYIAVGNYSKRPLEVEYSWDEPLSKPSILNCRAGGCEVTIRFGTNMPIKSLATRRKPGSTLVFRDGRPLLASFTQHTGAIEVQVQTLDDGLITHHFTTGKRLDIKKLGTPKP
jgi:hypothetical protein